MEAHVSALVSKKNPFYPMWFVSTSPTGQQQHEGLAVAELGALE